VPHDLAADSDLSIEAQERRERFDRFYRDE
jgi:hypothetical protein